MADTIFQNFAQGYQTGIEMGTAYEKDQAQTTSLSTQAKEAKDSWTNKLGERAALGRAQKAHQDIDITQNEGKIKVLNEAIKGSSDNVAVQQKLMKEKEDTEAQMMQAKMNGFKLQEAQRLSNYEIATEGLLNPKEAAAGMRKTGDKGMAFLADVYEDKLPISGTESKAFPKGKVLSQLDPVERQEFKSDVARALGTQKQETTAKDIMAELLRQKDIDRRAAADKEREGWELKKAAAAREKADTAKSKAEGIEKLEKAKGDIEDRYSKQRDRLEQELYGDGTMAHPGISETVKNPKSTFYNSEPAEIPNPAYEKKKKALEDLDTTFKSRMERLEKVSGESIGKGTKDDPIVLK